jgi:ATP-dependent DNA helicase DinG
MPKSESWKISSINNFPFPTLREKQGYVLNEIDAAIASGYRYMICQCPTGFGKSAAVVAAALTLGTSYIVVSSIDLQTQYARDFPFVRVAKGKGNFTCEVKDDFIRNNTYWCKPGLLPDSNIFFKDMSLFPPPSPSPISSKECPHTTVEYGPCISDKDFGCNYKTRLKDYIVSNKGTKEELITLNEEHYRTNYSKWYHIRNLKQDVIKDWRPCEYFHQLDTALLASHSVLNYPMLFAYKKFPSRELLVLDEAHLLEAEVVRFHGISISRKKWRRYIPDLIIDNHNYDIGGWLSFLKKLNQLMSDALDKILSNKQANAKDKVNEELLIELEQDLEKLGSVIEAISASSNDWIVSDVQRFNNEIIRVELKPLDVSPYCRSIFDKCTNTLMMSATILDKEMFCQSAGLPSEKVKFIQVGSDFPLENRPICPLNVAYLNYKQLQQEEVKGAIAKAVDRIMSHHKEHKGIVHTTSYEQLNFIKQGISEENRQRLLETNPDIERDEVLEEHFTTSKPTVLISPSLHLGLNLADDLSRSTFIRITLEKTLKPNQKKVSKK